jgi:hypothetical protein
MAGKKPGVNKSQAVRDILGKDPKAPVKEVVATLAGRGIQVSANYVYMLKSKARAKGRKARRQRAEAADPVGLVRDVKALAARAGGLRKLKQLVDILAE